MASRFSARKTPYDGRVPPAHGAGDVRDELARKWRERALSPESWLHTAKLLAACAERIGKPFTEDLLTPFDRRGAQTEDVPPMLFGPVLHLLAGYTFEALLKGILVARHRDVITGERLPEWLTHHNMEALLNRAGVMLQEADLSAFMRRAALAVRWSGRYPVPKDQTDMDVSVYSSADLDWFRDIYERLEALLQYEVRRLLKEGGK